MASEIGGKGCSRRQAWHVLACLSLSAACVPSTPPCECECGEGAFPDESALDRSESCLLEDDIEKCGYPAASEYGFAEGDTMANFVVRNCAGEEVEFAEFLAERLGPGTGTYNRGVVIGLGAGWCVPCQDEAKVFVEAVEYAGEKDVELIQILHQGVQAPQPATTETCELWSEEIAENAFGIYFDPNDELDDLIRPPGDDSLPWLMVVDANAHIRFKEGGKAIEYDVLIAEIDKLFEDPYGN